MRVVLMTVSSSFTHLALGLVKLDTNPLAGGKLGLADKPHRAVGSLGRRRHALPENNFH